MLNSFLDDAKKRLRSSWKPRTHIAGKISVWPGRDLNVALRSSSDFILTRCCIGREKGRSVHVRVPMNWKERLLFLVEDDKRSKRTRRSSQGTVYSSSSNILKPRRGMSKPLLCWLLCSP